jgi:hypothetical protein
MLHFDHGFNFLIGWSEEEQCFAHCPVSVSSKLEADDEDDSDGEEVYIKMDFGKPFYAMVSFRLQNSSRRNPYRSCVIYAATGLNVMVYAETVVFFHTPRCCTPLSELQKRAGLSEQAARLLLSKAAEAREAEECRREQEERDREAREAAQDNLVAQLNESAGLAKKARRKKWSHLQKPVGAPPPPPLLLQAEQGEAISKKTTRGAKKTSTVQSTKHEAKARTEREKLQDLLRDRSPQLASTESSGRRRAGKQHKLVAKAIVPPQLRFAECIMELRA